MQESHTKLTYLSTFVKGEALQAIHPMLPEFSLESYDKARRVLQERFGYPCFREYVNFMKDIVNESDPVYGMSYEQ